MLDKEILKYIDKSVLCWLATVDSNNQPNVSPKEVFTVFQNKAIVIANIASPKTVKNIKQNPLVCISFIDVFVQKGFQLKGRASILDKSNPLFEPVEQVLLKITKGLYPFSSITYIEVEKVKPIVAPSYFLYPETTTEEQQIKNALKTYDIQKLLKL